MMDGDTFSKDLRLQHEWNDINEINLVALYLLSLDQTREPIGIFKKINKQTCNILLSKYLNSCSI